MAHDIDITNGSASFVSARQDAWHQLGTTLPETFTAEEAMSHGNLGGWNVRKAPLLTADPETGETLEVPDKYAVLRDNPVDGNINVLGTVGSAYHVIQNEAHAELLNALVDESGAHFETAGALAGGRKVFLTMKLPGHLSIGGSDRVENYIVAVNSHDGSLAFTFMITPIRVVCQNTLNLAFGTQTNQFRVRHTRGSTEGIIIQARQALDLTFNYLDNFQADAERMINTTLTQVQFEELILREFGPGEDAAPATVTRTEAKLDRMAELFADAGTQDGIRGTAWAGLGALTEWYDHYSPTRGATRDLTRATNAILEPGFKNKALDLMMSLS